MLTTGKYSNFLHMKMNIVGSRVSERKLHKNKCPVGEWEEFKTEQM